MSQNDEIARVKVRIRALTARTIAHGCTEAEAMMAAEMVGRLLERYALTMEEVDVRQEQCVQVEVPIGGHRRRPTEVCVPALARFCDCKVWLARSEHQAHYVFFGFEMDVALAAYLFAVIARSIQTELERFRKARAALTGVALRRASTSFQGGMAVRVAERLIAMHTEREMAVAAQRPNGAALMLVRHQVVDEAFRFKKVPLRSMTSLRLWQNAAFRDGRAAGERVNLNRPLEGSGTVLLD